MTTHGRSGIGRWVWGSVAEKVMYVSHPTVLALDLDPDSRARP